MYNQAITLGWRKLARRLNKRGLFFEINPKPFPTLVVAGFTRSGTTYLAGILSSILKARYIDEPLETEFVEEVSFFHSRESAQIIMGNDEYIAALRSVFSPDFQGLKERGHYVLYKGERVVKVVRANFYLNVLSSLFPETRFCVIIRNPLSVIASRIRLGWEVPDHSKCLSDIGHELTFEQRKIFDSVTSKHERLAVSWCLDNMVALKNLGNRLFSWVFYENLVMNPREEIRNLLQKFDLNIPDRRIIKEITLYRASAPRKTAELIRSWEGILDSSAVKEVLKVVKKYNLSYLYDFKSGMPKHSFISDENKFVKQGD